LIDCSHSGVNIAERISLILAEYDLTSKVLSVTLDNASAMNHLTPSLTPLLSHYGFVNHVSTTIIGLPLLFI
jgi:hypothetical protein